MPKKDLSDLQLDKMNYDNDSRTLIDNLTFEKEEIGLINNMRQTEGWKILEKKIREELQERILSMVKDDLKIQTLLALLEATATKKRTKILENEILKLLPE